MRPNDSKRSSMSANILPIGTATRLTSGLLRDQQLNQQQLRAPTSRGGSVLNTELAVEGRPKTGILGIKSATPKCSLQFRRRIEDRSYYIGLLRERINAITAELRTILADYSIAEEEARGFGHYEKMAENLAAELRDLQVANSFEMLLIFDLILNHVYKNRMQIPLFIFFFVFGHVFIRFIFRNMQKSIGFHFNA
nr:intraflagellar transport protein 74 [Hymenolepis microstoma]